MAWVKQNLSRFYLFSNKLATKLSGWLLRDDWRLLSGTIFHLPSYNAHFVSSNLPVNYTSNVNFNIHEIELILQQLSPAERLILCLFERSHGVINCCPLPYSGAHLNNLYQMGDLYYDTMPNVYNYYFSIAFTTEKSTEQLNTIYQHFNLFSTMQINKPLVDVFLTAEHRYYVYNMIIKAYNINPGPKSTFLIDTLQMFSNLPF